MNKLSTDIAEMTRKNEQIILQYLSKVKQSNVASALSTSESTITRMKDGEITRILSFLAACGLKVIL